MHSGSTAPDPAGRAINWLERKIVYSVGFGVAVLLAIGVALFYFTAGASPTQVVRIAYGPGGTVRKYFLEQMAAHGRKRHLDIRLVPTGGTDQTLSAIDQNGADLGLIPGAIEDRGSRSVFEVAPLYMEPLQLLVREELYESVVKDFGQLRGKSIDLDAPSTATNLLASELLRFIGLTDRATGKPQYRPGAVPPAPADAIFRIGGVPSQSVRTLITDGNYRLVPLPFGGSFSLDKFREAETPDPAGGSSLRLDKTFVEESVIPAFTYGVLPAVPPGDTRTIATRLLLIGSPRLDNQTVSQVLALILSPEISSLAKPPLTLDLLNASFQFERHPGTEHYVNSLKPFSLDDVMQGYARMVEIWGVIIALYVAAAKGLKAWRTRRARLPNRSVGDFLGEVLAVEAAALGSCTNDERIALDRRLSEIKKTSIELHLDGRLDDAEDFPSLLVTLSDARTRIWGAVS